MTLARLLAAFAVLASCGTAAANSAQSEPHLTVLNCRNISSGSTWRITIDYARATVDSYPAHIGASTITWHDAKEGGTYTLNRKTGALTFVAPSSTGGYFLHHQCRLP